MLAVYVHDIRTRHTYIQLEVGSLSLKCDAAPERTGYLTRTKKYRQRETVSPELVSNRLVCHVPDACSDLTNFLAHSLAQRF